MAASDSPVLLYAFVLLAAVAYLSAWLKQSKRCNVPTLGPSAPLLSYWGAFRYITSPRKVLEEGQVKFGGRPFRVASMLRWQYIVSSPELIEELRRAPDSQLDPLAAADDILHFVEALGTTFASNTYHVPIVRTTLTKNIGGLLPSVLDEMRIAFADFVPAGRRDWQAVSAYNAITRIVTQTSSRIFVGAPLCRNPELIRLTMSYTPSVMKTGILMKLSPGFMKPIVKQMFGAIEPLIDSTHQLLLPTIEERQRMMAQHGADWLDKPNDMLQWLMDAAEGEERTSRGLTARLLAVYFAATDTAAICLIYALYRLAAHPEYAELLREEVESAIAEDGWTREAFRKMPRVDSFLKETMRLQGPSSLLLQRKAMKDFTFSDGTFIPKGSHVATSPAATHLHIAYYADPLTFDPWRFVGADDAAASEGTSRFATTSPEYLLFGYGRHACAGRFFAEIQLEMMMAHIVTTYDVRLETPGVLPRPVEFGSVSLPNMSAKVLFKERVGKE
ncbi:cytochrome P450 [Phanerochaete sordida]|uniref:Cytochrome P450 n=1 Tax=Phanerochaete sordida TaxID=48140 RepID=A0A9P3LBX4_9APHY|nr:cytochrome P450 [Phanerochaete sordida]